ncbi:iron ABC transporter substrate-binding protein [Paraoerskovia sediminicola]|uniref:Iron ABC transporter substrate-binding protein n=1 Tax=Paraoerskovia sediminicola TaxID=1138587 RepID=A0ABM8G7A5_9CELL|nr:siderophore ABC transporter substrate-binding protein [Paraoerskovia sediminicola]BDZ43969.1 iron ABC transporter substrate-binding protein [Paraoerskovia sediminicola]
MTHVRTWSTGLFAAAAALSLLTACATDEGAGAEPEATSTDGADAQAEAQDESAYEAVSIEHPQGTLELDAMPETVVTFDLAALTVLDELGVEVTGVPKTNLTADLESYAGDEYLDAGTLFEPDFEAVAAAAPDLIVVAGRSAAAYPELAKIAPTVDLSNDWADFAASVKENDAKLGEIFDKEDEVAALADEFDAKASAVQAAAADAGSSLIVLTSAGEVTAYGPGSRFGFLHDALGLTPAVEDVEEATHGEAISFEFVRDADPDHLFVVDRDAAVGEGTDNAQAVLDNELVHGTTAWQEDQVTYVDPASWYIVNGGLPTLIDIADEVGAAIGADV